jgi:sugar O-acyltransferase (sialic acid O-acetyltransferase NeuD family)
LKVILIGAANPHSARMIRDIEAVQSGLPDPYKFVGFIDANPDIKESCGLPVYRWDELRFDLANGYSFANTISGSTRARMETTQRVLDTGARMVNFIHPSVELPESLGDGAYFQEGVVIQAGCKIGRNVTIHSGALLSHEAVVGDHCFVGPHACVCGRVTIGEGAYLGANCTIIPDIRIGAWATIGAGSVVIRDVLDYAVMVGNPARQIGPNVV